MPSAHNVMLAIHAKRTDNVDLKGPILTYIRETYSDREADEAVDDLAVVQQLRNEIATAQAGSQAAFRDSLTK
jgi:programmed cell death 6-interacting protein